jgi:hypothetical protein
MINTNAILEVILKLSLKDISVSNLDNPQPFAFVKLPFATVFVSIPARVNTVTVSFTNHVVLSLVLFRLVVTTTTTALSKRRAICSTMRSERRRTRFELLLENCIYMFLRHGCPEEGYICMRRA